MNLNTFNALFEYRSEEGDQWRIPKVEDKILGDCEDYALGVLYYVVCEESLFNFWLFLLLGRAKIHYVKNDNEGHAVLQVDGEYIDNWTKDWVSKRHMEAIGHKFHFLFYLTYQVALKMLYTKVRGLL